MRRLLFCEEPHKDKRYILTNRFLKIFFFILFLILVGLGIVCLLTVDDDPYSAIVCFGFALFMLCISLYYACLGEQYLYIYEDCIRCRMPYWRRERILRLTPDCYRIKLKRVPSRSRLTVRFLFLSPDGAVLLRYGACTLYPSLYQAEKAQWEINLFSIGCEIIDDNEIIVNR